MSELHDKARVLLALREKASPGPWSVYEDVCRVAAHGAQNLTKSSARGEYMTESLTNSDGDFFRADDAMFVAAAHGMADTVRDLLVENETIKRIADNFQRDMVAERDRAEAAESRLRKLCDMKPVAWAKFDGSEITHMEMSDGFGADLDLPGNGYIPLIPRPEMPR